MADRDRGASAQPERRAVPRPDRGPASGAEAETGPKRQWHYPSYDEHPDEQIFIYDKWCKSCGICYSMCPKGVLTSDKAGRPVVSDPDACIACGLCEILCPDMAITVHKPRKGKGAAESAAGRTAVKRGETSPETGDE
jgi:2-oxoglutarate ferredoxin oxidoreductase subunit delta